MNFTRHRLRGDSPQLNSPVLDRRHSPRREVYTPQAALSWSSPSAETTIQARLVNLSQGGAGLLVRELPPPGNPIRLILSGSDGAVVEGRVVGTRPEEEGGWTFLHMMFSRDCPDRVLRKILGEAADDR